MIKIRHLWVLVPILFILSCSAETMNTNEMLQSQNPSALLSGRLVYEKNLAAVNAKTQRIKYTADLTNILGDFPKFTDATVNNDVSRMKFFIQQYIFAVRSNNRKKERRYYNDYVAIFRKLQILRKRMNPDESALLQRYLIRVKANINSIEYLS